MTLNLTLEEIRAKIIKAQASKLASDKVTIIVASKTQNISNIQPLINAGQKKFGENKVQEATNKWANRADNIELHFIGHLQSNKASEATKLFDVIETIDSEKLVLAISKCGYKGECYIQINIGDEEQKGGISPLILPKFYEFCINSGLNITGLMCIPPANIAPAPYFALMYKMKCELNLKNLSMGMSGDFEEAVRFGATHIRIGTALFGERQ